MKFVSDDFFSITPKQLKIGFPLLFDLFIHLPLNNRIILIRQAGEMIEDLFVEKFKIKFKIESFFIKKSDRSIFEIYCVDETRGETQAAKTSTIGGNTKNKTNVNMTAPDAPISAPPPPPSMASPAKENASAPQDQSNKVAMANPIIEPAIPAEKIVADLLKPDPDRSRAFEEGKKLVKKILQGAPPEMTAIIENPVTEHATTVAIYSALFAMGLGKNDQQTLQDLIIASLMHDLGLSQIASEVLATPETKRTPEQKEIYEWHSTQCVPTLIELGYTPNQRTTSILEQHHERFDGTGYPKHLAAFKIEELAQMLCFADLLDTIGRGHYDGISRSLQESIGVVGEIERQTSFPRYFNPDLFKKLRNWLTKGGGTDYMESVSSVVKETQEKLSKAS